MSPSPPGDHNNKNDAVDKHPSARHESNIDSNNTTPSRNGILHLDEDLHVSQDKSNADGLSPSNKSATSTPQKANNIKYSNDRIDSKALPESVKRVVFKNDKAVVPNGEIGINADSGSDDELLDFFPATRPGFNKIAGDIKAVTRADFDDFNRRKHLECFARSMESWKNFEKNHDPNDYSFLDVNFDRYRDVFVNVDTNKLTTLEQFMLELLGSREDFAPLMSRLRRKYRIAPSKREMFECLQQMQTAAINKQVTKPKEEAQANGDVVVDDSNRAESNLGESNAGDSNYVVRVDTRTQRMLRNKATRSNSGVVVITVMTSPGTFSCSEDCHYCPNEPGQPRSYLSTEPAVLRANQNDFDALKQFYDRAITLYKNGHVVDKIEIIVLGGTWSGYPRAYQIEFIRDLFYASNIFPSPPESARERKSLLEEQTMNEGAACRIIGLTLETRPDRITPHEIEMLRNLGCTRVQLGIQHVDNEILALVNRGHTIEDSIRAIYLLKENGFKVDIHIMPDLPGSNPEKDIEMFARILGDEGLQVDQWKIYPCEVTPFTEIEKWHKEGKHVPYFDVDPQILKDVIMRVKRAVHPWIRLNRVIRDIPNPSIIAGTNITNMRQLLQQDMKSRGLQCCCIRCKEVKDNDIQDSKMHVRRYSTLGGTEYFLSFEQGQILGFLRLRIRDCSKYNPSISRFECLNDAALVRELHVYGPVVVHGKATATSGPSQHRGIGTSLLLAAEIIALSKGINRMAIIAGIGTREYYAKCGYKLDQTYMVKELTPEDIATRLSATHRNLKVPETIEIEHVDCKVAQELVKEPLPPPNSTSPPKLHKNAITEYIDAKAFILGDPKLPEIPYDLLSIVGVGALLLVSLWAMTRRGTKA
ncbi:bifunctional Elp3-MiaB-NifB/Radical SAM [Babesia duncani]|uniref:tRNA carboxymethyluridine synthase n=1 Tax=Babesia duncani TaxID=323732 RepID=A0AAD9PIU5_9APIC|nr:bifunctional Elp3-MiaB-NifB/Radical SAM [Babesia duncani]